MIQLVNQSLKILCNISKKKQRTICTYCSDKPNNFTLYFPCEKHLRAQDIDMMVYDHLQYGYDRASFRLALKIHKYGNFSDFIQLLEQPLPINNLDLNTQLLDESIFQNPSIIKKVIRNICITDVVILLELMRTNFGNKKVNWASEFCVNLIYFFSQFPSTKIDLAQTIVDEIFSIPEKVKFYILNQVLSHCWLSRKRLLIDYYTTLIRTFELTNIENVYKEVLQ